MKPYQQRVVEERETLVGNLSRLSSYLNSNPTSLPKRSLELLREQEVLMSKLAVVLHARINQFENE